MNIKKSLVVVPLSLSLLFPTVSMVSANTHSHSMDAPTVTTPATDLRAALDALLSEHAYLAVVAMQKGIDGKEDFEAAAAALGENTESLSAAVASRSFFIWITFYLKKFFTLLISR
jgi:hypothetical protein